MAALQLETGWSEGKEGKEGGYRLRAGGGGGRGGGWGGGGGGGGEGVHV